MRMLDRKLTTPHRLVVFEGGHTLPPDDVAIEAIEWMELQAMQSGARPRDGELIDRLFAKRQQQISDARSDADVVHRLEAIVEDFAGLRDVTAEAGRAKEMLKRRKVKSALERERGRTTAKRG